MNVKELLMTVLFKVKFLYKIFVFIDFTIKYRKIPKSMVLTNKRDLVRVNGHLFGFYSDFWMHGEIPEEESIWEV